MKSYICLIVFLFSLHLYSQDKSLVILEKQAFEELNEFKINPTYEGYVKLRNTTDKLSVALKRNAPLEDKIALYNVLINIGNEIENIKENIIYKEFQKNGRYDKIMKAIGFERSFEGIILGYIDDNFNSNDHQILSDSMLLTNKNDAFYMFITNILYLSNISNTNQITHGTKSEIHSAHSDTNSITEKIQSVTNQTPEKIIPPPAIIEPEVTDEILGVTKRNLLSALMMAGGGALLVMTLLYAFWPRSK